MLCCEINYGQVGILDDTLIHPASQSEIPSRNLPQIADFRLKCCILMRIAKNKITGSCQ
jgi:hypothetical protein